MAFEEVSEALHESLNGADKPQAETVEASAENNQTPTNELVDLSNIGKFRWEGKDWTLEDLKKSVLMQSDYTKKTQALAKERQEYQSLVESRKFDVNLKADIKNVLQNPDLVSRFKDIYPAEYHEILDMALKNVGQNNQQGSQTQQTQPNSVNPVIDKRLSQVEHALKEQMDLARAAQVEAAGASIDSVFSKMSKKYPMADEEVVIARAQALLEKGVKLTNDRGEQNEDVWDKIWKTINDATQKRFEGHYKKQVDEQKSANVKARDTASGGGIPGQGPRPKMTIKEATAAAIKHFENR